MLKFWLRLCLALVLVAPAGATLAASGTAVGVDPDAEARGTETRTLVVGADIFIGDRVVTDDAGLVQIVFTDNTRLVVGPRSELLIEDYLLRDNGSAGNLAINALSGAFRFISGNAPSNLYNITTPTGTIGVRGTALDFYVLSFATYILQLQGATLDCPAGASGDACRLLEASCHWGVLSEDEFELMGHADGVTGAQRDEIKQWFQFANSQRGLLGPFRVEGAERCMRRPPPSGGGGSLSTTSSSAKCEPNYLNNYCDNY